MKKGLLLQGIRKEQDMKKRLLILVAFSLVVGITGTGCSMLKHDKESETENMGSETQVSPTGQTEREQYFDESDEYFNDGQGGEDNVPLETEFTQGVEDNIPPETDFSDEGVSKQLGQDNAMFYHEGDSVPVIISEGDLDYSGTATIESFVTGDEATELVSAFNSQNKEIGIDPLPSDYSFAAITYRLDILDAGVVAPISSQLPLRVEAPDGESDLTYNGVTYKSGLVYHTSEDFVKYGDYARNTVIFALPSGCTDFSVVLGDGTSVIEYR